MNLSSEDWGRVKRVFQYLNGMRNLGLCYISNQPTMVAYSDASFADCEGSVSTCGFVIQMYGDTITW